MRGRCRCCGSPEVGYQADDDQDGDILNPPDRARDQSDPLIDSALPPEKDGEEDQTDDKANDRLSSGPAGPWSVDQLKVEQQNQ